MYNSLSPMPKQTSNQPHKHWTFVFKNISCKTEVGGQSRKRVSIYIVNKVHIITRIPSIKVCNLQLVFCYLLN